MHIILHVQNLITNYLLYSPFNVLFLALFILRYVYWYLLFFVVVVQVEGIVHTNRQDTSNSQYQGVIKNGDALLNRVQKLARIINV